MPKTSSGSLKIFSQDINAVKRLLKKTLKIWKAEHPEICSVFIFGSFVKGDFTPGSDIDVLLILSDSKRSFRDRLAKYYPENFPISVDLFPFTISEIKEMRNHPSIYKTAVETGIEIKFRRYNIN